MISYKVVLFFTIFFFSRPGIRGPPEPDEPLEPVYKPFPALSPSERELLPHDYNAKKTRSMLVGTVPDKFKTRFRAGEDDFQECADNINEIPHQGHCDICHSVSSASVMSNRWCIALTKNRLDHLPIKARISKNDQISAYHVAACHDYAQVKPPSDNERCTQRSNQFRIYRHAAFVGYITGNAFGPAKTRAGCHPYPFQPNEKVESIQMTCPGNDDKLMCKNVDYKKPYLADFRQIDTYWVTDSALPDLATDPEKLRLTTERMKFEIFTNGPINAAVAFTPGTSKEKVITEGHELAKKMKAGELNHLVRIIGWEPCKDETDPDFKKLLAPETACWLVANSYGKRVHQLGILMLEMGKNVMKIEQSLSAPTVVIRDALCVAADFLNKGLNAAIWIKDGLYLFQGHCTQRLSYKNFKLTPDGPPDFTQKIFVGAPAIVVHTKVEKLKVGAEERYYTQIFDLYNEGVSIQKPGTAAGITPVRYLAAFARLTVSADQVGEVAAENVQSDGSVTGSRGRYTLTQLMAQNLPDTAKFHKIEVMQYVESTMIAVYGQDKDGKAIAGLFDCDLRTAVIMAPKPMWKVPPQSQAEFLKAI